MVLVGFGTVGRGVAERLRASAGELESLGIAPRIVGVLDPRLGSVAAPSGLDPASLLQAAEGEGDLTQVPGALACEGGVAGVREIQADVVFELTPTNLRDGQPGLDHVRAALENGRHVSTTNKGPVALAWPELRDLAAANNVQLRCEGTVMSGTPLLNVCEAGLAGAGVRAVRGILNGTCNYILSRMEEGMAYDDALNEAQRLGYAETDPSGDVEGWDAAAKVAILGNLVLGGSLSLADVERGGIDSVDLDAVQNAVEGGKRLRLVGSVERGESAVTNARVTLEELPQDDPLAAVSGAGNLLTFETDALGAVSVAGPGAGRAETGHALVADLIAIHRAELS